MKEQIQTFLSQHTSQIISDRRDFHQYPEAGWTEFRTASLVARRLKDLGYELQIGRQVIVGNERMGLPSHKELEYHLIRAKEQGGDPEFLDVLKGGYTGVVGVLKNGEGPKVALRFDMDALMIAESHSSGHFPQEYDFVSKNSGVMHACGHDGHSAIGLGVAALFSQFREQWSGTIKLIFQPAEEGVRGAKSMVAGGVVDDIDYFIGHHLFPGWRIGELICGMSNFAATQKLNTTITGKPSHAGSNPQGGNNAMLAAATAVLNLHAISRHSDGSTRVNVGKLQAGTSRNVICEIAQMEIETRGEDMTICDYVTQRAERILKAASEMHNCQLKVEYVGAAENARCDREFSQQVAELAEGLGYHCLPPLKSAGSEDITWMMNRVMELGGKATLIGIGADRNGIGLNDKQNRDKVLAPHTESFDFDEAALPKTVELLASIVFSLIGKAKAD